MGITENNLDKGVVVPELNDLVQLSLIKFRSKELINTRIDNQEEMTPYSPLWAVLDVIEEVFGTGVTPLDLMGKMVQSTSLRVDQLPDYEDIIAPSNGNTWDELFSTISEKILHAELRLKYPEIVDEYKLKWSRFRKDDPDELIV